jgi:hypothetical protein
MAERGICIEHLTEDTLAKIEAQDLRLEKMHDFLHAGGLDHLFPKRARRRSGGKVREKGADEN